MKQNIHDDMQKVFEPVIKSIIDFSEDVTKTVTETSKGNNKALANLNDKLSEIRIDKGVLASFLLFLLSKNTNPENTSQFNHVIGPNSNRLNDLVINKTILVTLSDNSLTFRVTNAKFE